MIAARWRKVLADLWGNKVRSALTILTIAVGLFAVGFIAVIADIAMSDMDADFQSANAHAAVLYTSPFTEDLLPALQRVAGVADVEGRSSVDLRAVTRSERLPTIQVVAVPALAELRIDRLTPVEPAHLPALKNREIWLTDSALGVIPAQAG